MNVIDKVVNAISPNAGLNRAVARQKMDLINSGYGNYGASQNKNATKGWKYGGGSAKEDIEDNIDILRQRSRDLYAGVPVATGALKTMRTNCVGSGLTLKSQINNTILGIDEETARKLESKIETEFELWANSKDCDIERLDNFYGLQQLAFLNWLMSGDVIATLPITKRVNMPYDLRVMLIEADRVCNPTDKLFDVNITEGVEKNDLGEVVAYHIANKHPLTYEYRVPNKWVRVEAVGKTTGRRNVLHIMNRERIGQVRGIPFLAPVIESFKQLGRYTEAELVAAVVSGMFTVFIEKEGVGNGEFAIGEMIPEDQQIDRNDQSTIELAPGAIVDLNEGEKANATSPGRPNANFDGFVVSILKQIGSALEIPYEVLMKNYSSSYSASRGALLEAWKMFKMYRSWLADDFCQPIFEEWLSEAVAKGRINAPGFFTDPLIRKAYCGASWNGPTQGLMNPNQEVDAAAKRVAEGFSTRSREAREMNGSDFYENVQQLKEEDKLLKEALGVNEQK